MNTWSPQLALREWGRDMRRTETLAVLAGIAGVLALVGPFDTDLALRFLPRLAYWLVTVMLTYSAGHLASGMVRMLAPATLARVPMILLTGLAIGLAVSLTVMAINAAAFGLLPTSDTLPPFLASVFGIALVIATVFDIVERAQPATAQTIPLLDRLPLDKRGALVALTVEDHYVRIITTKGEEMVLMRLSDAIREAGNTAGLQTHRSHWVATAAIKRADRLGDRATLHLHDGRTIPVSRANMPKLREAGLLPK